MSADASDPLSRRQFLAAAATTTVLAGCSDTNPAATPDSPNANADAGTDTASGDVSLDTAPDLPTDLPVDAETGPKDTFEQAAYVEDLALFPLGVQAGDPTSDGAVLWTRYAGSDPLQLVIFDRTAPHVVAAAPPVAVADGGFVHYAATALEPATAYAYAFVGGSQRSPTGRFTTAPSPDALPVVVFGGASCAKFDFAPFDVLDQAAAYPDGLDFFLKAGDTTYADDSEDLATYRQRWYENEPDMAVAPLGKDAGAIRARHA